MKLPDLPRVLKKREADLSPAVFAWFEKNYPNSVAIEIKVKGGRAREHQIIALKKVQNGSFAYKIVDTGIRLPFDGFVLKNADAFLVECDGNKCTATSPSGKTIKFNI